METTTLSSQPVSMSSTPLEQNGFFFSETRKLIVANSCKMRVSECIIRAKIRPLSCQTMVFIKKPSPINHTKSYFLNASRTPLRIPNVLFVEAKRVVFQYERCAK